MSVSLEAKIGFGISSAVVALGVVASYVFIFIDSKKHDYWISLSSATQYALYPLWVAAAIGFLVYTISTLIKPSSATKGIFSNEYVPYILILTFLVLSLLWSASVLVHFKFGLSSMGWVASASLVGVAVCTMLMIAGEAESNGAWYKLISLLFLGMVTVLVDAVAWNSRFIQSLI